MSRNGVGTVMGTNQIGCTINEKDLKIVLSKFKEAGFNELDSAVAYNDGKTADIISQCGNQDIKLSTKANPWGGKNLGAECLRSQLEESLKAFKRESFDIFYLHHPDETVPIEETLRCLDVLYKEGKFKEFGLSNFKAWQVAEVYNICHYNNWVKPSVYQGCYNALNRNVEFELIPCLRNYKIRFYAYSPLAAGILTGKHCFNDINEERSAGRFWSAQWKEVYINTYWKEGYFDGIEKLKAVIGECHESSSISLTEASLRWLYHHSKLSGKHGDAVILGFSKVEQIESNLQMIEKGRLNEKIATAFERLWVNTMHLGIKTKINL